MSIVEKQITKARKAINMTQVQLAVALGFKNKQTVSNWENSKSEPDSDTLVKISEICNVTIDWLLKGEDVAAKVEHNVDNMAVPSGTGQVSHIGPTHINNSSPSQGDNIQSDLISTVLQLNKKIFLLEAEIEVLKEENLKLSGRSRVKRSSD
ncbi:MAG: helix-turn-helix transcriptional regulator [Ignavibacteria bacterium]|jgi:transcriptional regulator with XRE-family HTH domain|nr:helix-turn-helix transcriptional regulator [Ignavibacteria bacterium]MCU7503786.1 helix-turn-helix transcriptional regulator [Ignavibacteria bacterium]MCU7517200.1 helix-turn-helix transcriptional regulator [Ignavibacteria bacterium]